MEVKEYSNKKRISRYRKVIDDVAKKLFSFHSQQPEERFFKLHEYDKDWYRALAQVGRRYVFKFKTDYKFNDKIYSKELFGFDKNRQNKANHSSPIVYTKLNQKGKYVRRNDSWKTETDVRKSQ